MKHFIALPRVKELACVCLSLVAGVHFAHAGEFERVYSAALEYDARFQGAKHSLRYTEEGVALARSSLLPSVSVNLSDTAVRGTREISGVGSTDLDYRAPTQSINFRAPLVNFEGAQQYRQAQAQAETAKARFASSRGDLIDRLTVAYLQRMLAEDNFQVIHTQIQALVEQRNLMRKRLDRGEGTKTELAEARANLSLVQAQWADARDQVTNTQIALEMISGQKLEKPNRLGVVFEPSPLTPAALEKWQEMATQGNQDVETKRRAIEVAKAGVARSSAGHLPRLDLVASASSSRNDSVSTLNQSINQSAVGLQLNIPIYSGGAITASVRQALAEQARAEADYLSEQRALEQEVKRLFQIVQNGKSKLEAYEDALEASRVALDGTQKGQLSGLRTNADVLEALRKVSQAQRDLAQARYDHILQRLRLFNKAGLAPETVVAYVDELLTQPGKVR
jgi:outer membrane protein, protease secretion system